jgi:hypothetical protein
LNSCGALLRAKTWRSQSESPTLESIGPITCSGTWKRECRKCANNLNRGGSKGPNQTELLTLMSDCVPILPSRNKPAQ